MPLRDDLLAPIPGENPSGSSLRYDKVYDQIKEARTEEDESLPSGAWARQTKRADFRLAAKLAGDALAARSKDLQLAVWLGEALFKLEGIATLAPVLRLLLDLQQTFWETLHPEIDEGDTGMRAAPLQWAANRYGKLVNEAPLTRKGISILEYKAARALGTEDEASSNTARREQREEAIAAGKLTAELLDEAIAATPKAFYVALEQSLTEAGEALLALDLYCEERYGDDSPSYRTLRQGIEELLNLASSLLREKRKLDPDPVEETGEGSTGQDQESEETNAYAGQAYGDASAREEEEEREPEPVAAVVAAAPPRRAKAGAQSPTPESWDDALARIEGAVTYMAAEQPESALPFLVRSAMRSAELRELAAGSELDQLVAPPTELRQSLRRAAGESEWSEVHRSAMSALATPCGRGWLDLYRYLWTSCRAMGWETQESAIAGAVAQRLREVPELTGWTLNDDTPCANAETLRWIAEEIAPPPEPAPPCEACEARAHRGEEATYAAPTLDAVLAVERERASREDAPELEDLFATARGMAAHGQIQGAIQLLARDASHQSVGRLRFGRNLQIAELCLESGNSAVAVPVLQGLVREVEERRLESWEPTESAARPYALLLQCAAVAKLDTQAIFARLCAIDPSAALTMAPPVEG